MGPRFVGRHRELAVLQRVWETVRRGDVRVVGVSGDAGVGKTALVRHFLGTTGAVSVWASGDEEEAELPWAVLSQLIPAEGSASPVFLAHTLAAFLRGTERVVVIDDAQWADRSSMAAVRLTVRRLAGEPVMVIVVRQGGGLDDGWRRLLDSDRGVRLDLAGLPPADLVRLAVGAGHPGLSLAGAARLHEHTGGHPLHVRHLLDELPMHSIVFGHGSLPAPREIATTVRSRLASCQTATRELVAAGAVIGRRFSLAQARQLGDVTADAVAEAVEARLLEEIPGSMGQDLAFTSTLVRGLVYHDLDRTRRRDLHLRAARSGGSGAVWHRVAAAHGPDARLADDIEQAAHEHVREGRLLPAAVHLRHALDLTPPGPARRRRLLTAVEALLVVGDVATTARYQGDLATGSGPWSDYVAGYQLMLTGQIADAKTLLDRALAAVHTSEPGQPDDLEARIATQLTIIAVLTLSWQEMITHGATAVATARTPWVAAHAWLARTVGLAVAGRGTEALAELSAVDEPGAPSGIDGLVARGMTRLWTDDLDGAHRDLTTAVARAIGGETLRTAQALGFLGEVEYRRGALDEAVLHAELAVGDAEENNRFWDYAMLHALASYPLAAQGEWEKAESHAATAATWARKVGTPSALSYAAAAKAGIAQARGDGSALLAAAEELALYYPGRESGTSLLGPLRADALSQLGRVAEAAKALDAFTATLVHQDRLSTQVAIARVRARLALAAERHGQALDECVRALGLARTVGLPIEAARAELLAGVCQAALGRRAAAERTLRSVLRQFRFLGAWAYAAQTLAVSDAAGLSLEAPPAALDDLTRAERAVVTLVCHGLSNREIAERLVLSTKTVEFHLTNVFRKLDVADRGELRRVLAD
ncbi:AAA family ATPase [Actinophytocola sp.]|uniref:AAA family ATPase n=1 Tax=Actinophytocola sp. TaxID=1872138 RepID=UPI002ECFF875